MHKYPQSNAPITIIKNWRTIIYVYLFQFSRLSSNFIELTVLGKLR